MCTDFSCAYVQTSTKPKLALGKDVIIHVKLRPVRKSMTEQYIGVSRIVSKGLAFVYLLALQQTVARDKISNLNGLGACLTL